MGNNTESTIYHRAPVMGYKGNSIYFAVRLAPYALSLQQNPSLHFSISPII